MKKQQFKLLTFILFAVFISNNTTAQTFEGIIEFRKITPIDTINFIYYIKDDKVRIDEIGYDKQIEGIMLVDIVNFKAKSLSPARMLFVEMESPTVKEFMKIKDVNVSKGKKTHTISGYKCQEWVVVKKDQNLQVTYYLAPQGFNFFESMLITMNRKDKISTLYQQLPETKSAFPFYAIEADLQGKTKNILEVTSVTKKPLDQSLFIVPIGYKRFEK